MSFKKTSGEVNVIVSLTQLVRTMYTYVKSRVQTSATTKKKKSV